jgi:hypothetical protein
MCHERKILELMLWLNKHLVIIFEKEIFKNTNRCLQPCFFALEAPVRPTQATGLTGDNGLTDVTERSDRFFRCWLVHGTGLTDDHDRSDRSPDKIPPRFFMTKMRWRIGGSL